jgi:putative membrane protein
VSEPRDGEVGGRLHVAAVLLVLLRQLPGLIPLIVAGAVAPWFALAGAAVALGASFVRWMRFRWRVAGDALVIEEGLITRKRRVLPLERIQTVELVRPLPHRLLGVVELRVEAGGSGASEGRLDALRPDVARRLRATLLGEPVQAPPRGDVLARATPWTLVLAGLTGGRVGVVAALLGFGDELLGDRFEQLFALPQRLGVAGIVGLVIVLLLVGFLISLAATVFAFWGLELRADDEALFVRRGLLEQRLDTLPRRRIQALVVEENLVRRLIGRAAVRVEVAGRPDEEARKVGVLLPLGHRAEALALVERLLRVEGLAGAPLAPMPIRARSRRLRRVAVVTLVLTAAVSAVAGWPGLGVLAVAVPLVAWAFDAYRSLGHGEHSRVAIARSGVVVRRTAFVPVDRLQSLALSSTWFQRRLRLSTLALQIPGSTGRSDPRWIDLDRAAGERLLHRLAEAVPAS